MFPFLQLITAIKKMLNYHHQPTQVTAQSALPRHILEEIVWYKQQEVAVMSEQLPLADLKLQVSFAPTVRNFLNALRQNSTPPSIIAEVKKASQVKE